MSAAPTFTAIELPFIEQLIALGWKLVFGSPERPSVIGRETFREVLIKSKLRKAIRRINLRHCKPWLDGAPISQEVSPLKRILAPKVIEANHQAASLRVTGLAVNGMPCSNQGRSKGPHDKHSESKPFTLTEGAA